jgi:hypothetical protein
MIKVQSGRFANEQQPIFTTVLQNKGLEPPQTAMLIMTMA